ncbi:major facilitator superfamily domain-containing protein [Gongronella butleri]|nr:major facilitator superfamily domain-containing protein [Gongronella butleri]
MALVAATVSGPHYVFPTYGTSLATKFQWSALENSLVSTACFMGISFSGPLCSFLIERYGPKGTLRLSAFLGSISLFLLAQTYKGVLPGPFELCAFYLVLAGTAGAAAYLCALDSQSHNFRHHRGMAMGFTSATLGLCGLVFSQINDYFFKNPADPEEDDTYGFLLFLSVTTLFGMFVPSFVLGPLLHENDEALDSSPPMYNRVPPTTDLTVYPSMDTLDVGLDDDGCSSHPTLVDDSDIDSDADAPLLGAKKPTNYMLPPQDEEEAVIIQDDDDVEPAISGWALFMHPVGQTMFVALFVSLGIGYVYLASVGQILLSLPAIAGQPPQHVRNVHVSIFSFANCTARAFFGTLSDFLKNRFGIHRLWVFWAGIIGLGFAQLYLVTSVTTAQSLIPCTIAIALVYGLSFGIAPAATAEFGTNVFARNWGILLFAPALGSQLFNVLFGALYDMEADKQGVHICQGPECFRHTYWVGIATDVICAILMTWTLFKLGFHRRLPTTA